LLSCSLQSSQLWHEYFRLELLYALRLRERRGLLKDVLERSIPITHQDVVLIFVTVSGWRDARLTQETYARKVYAREVGGRLMSAIQLTTAAGVCAMVDLHANGQLPAAGFVRSCAPAPVVGGSPALVAGRRSRSGRARRR